MMLTRRYATKPQPIAIIGAFFVAASAFAAEIIPLPLLFASAENPIDEKLAAAKRTYEQGRANAKEALGMRYRELISAQSAKKKLDDATRIQDELRHFERDGLLLGRDDMTKAFLKYGETLKKVSDELAEAYSEAADAHVKAGELDRADELRRELAAYSLPAKLVSIHLLRSRVYIMHGGYKGLVKPSTNDGEKLNSTFELVNGLAESGYVSIRSVNCPNHYLNHAKQRVLLSRVEDSDGFRMNATFKKVKGLASPGAVSFEAVNYPGYYLRARDGELWLDKADDTDRFRHEASFIIGAPLFKLWE